LLSAIGTLISLASAGSVAETVRSVAVISGIHGKVWQRHGEIENLKSVIEAGSQRAVSASAFQ